MESHDPELRRHADAVAAQAGAVAAALDLAAAARREIRHAALLHDVGTLALPTAVTAKPGPLDDEERAFVEHHTQFGERVIATTPELREVATIVRASHERWDGDGYPDRLAGEAIRSARGSSSPATPTTRSPASGRTPPPARRRRRSRCCAAAPAARSTPARRGGAGGERRAGERGAGLSPAAAAAGPPRGRHGPAATVATDNPAPELDNVADLDCFACPAGGMMSVDTSRKALRDRTDVRRRQSRDG